MPPLVIAGAIAAAGAVGGAAIASHGASSAADAQAQAANSAAQLQHQDAQQALGFQEGQYANSQRELAPYSNVGYSSVANLANLLGILPNSEQAKPVSSAVTGTATPSNSLALSTSGTNGGAGTPAGFGINIPSNLQNLVNTRLGASGSLLQPFSGITMQNDPGYQFRINQGEQALQNSAAGRGELLSGNTLKALSDYGQNAASGEYNNAYARYTNDQTNTFNRLASLAGLGQSSTNALISAGNNSANNISNTLLTSGQQIGQNINNAGAARASGYAANGNIWGSTLGGIGGDVSNLLLMRNLLQPSSSTQLNTLYNTPLGQLPGMGDIAGP